ncbi:MAG: hypothetical protein ACOYLO_14975 [Ferruginibacter sp.]
MTVKFLLPFLLVPFLFSCNTEEIGNSKDVAPDTIYTSYTMAYSEGESLVNCTAQFRFAGPLGTTLVLNNPSNIQLDGHSIPIDSSSSRGAFYEFNKPMSTFTGSHTWSFTDIAGKTYEEPFMFEPVTLQSELPATIKTADLLLKFNGVNDNDSMSVTVIDTTKPDADNEQKYRISNGTVLLPAALFKNLKPGTLKLYCYLIRKKALQNCPKEGGLISEIHYLKERTLTLERIETDEYK